MNTMGPMGGGVQNQPAPPYRQAGGKPGAVNVGQGVGQANVGLQPNQHMQSVSRRLETTRNFVLKISFY